MQPLYLLAPFRSYKLDEQLNNFINNCFYVGLQTGNNVITSANEDAQRQAYGAPCSCVSRIYKVIDEFEPNFVE